VRLAAATPRRNLAKRRRNTTLPDRIQSTTRHGVTIHQIVDGNSLTVLTRGAERLDALLALIEGARTSLRLLYYILASDAAGLRVREAMIDAANRGVAVRLIVDGFGSDTSGDSDFLGPLKDAGVDVCAFIPRFGRRYLLRNHQKLALADEKRALIGGFNIADAYFADHEATAWRDLGLRIDGAAATRLTGYFDALFAWTQTPKPKMRALRDALSAWSNPVGNVRWLHGGPVRRLSPWLRALRDDLLRATDVSLVAAYFAPTPRFTRLIDRVAKRGRARVLTAGRTDNPATIGAARFTFPGLLRKGTRVFEYEPCRLHTKLYVIDSAVHIGSANFDPRSLFLNLEIMLRIDDTAFADAMRSYIDGEVATSRERKLSEFSGIASAPDRLRNALCYFLVAVLDPSVTRRLNMGID
jgi:cardiolipin synthase A/B